MIGVYICHCGINISATVDVETVREYAESLEGVAVSRAYTYMCSEPGQTLIKEDIKNFGLEGVVVASCSPRMHEPTFRKTCEDAGLNSYCFEMANIREQCSWVHLDREKATEKAKDLVRMAVTNARLLEPLERAEFDVTRAALVIGGGIAGIQSALDIADAGFEVYLLEKEPSIGGRMAQLDKTFPTLDCSACILTPKMVDVAHHPKIRLITYAELEEVSGYIGNFKVKIRKKPRYVDEEKCTGCGQCASVCPMMVLNDFDENLGTRSAIYVPFPQAVPLKYTRELESCMGCGLCKVACEPGAIDFDQREEEIELEVGTISVATGYDLFDATKKPEYKYGIYDNVITGLEFERLVSASGPTAGKILIGQFCEANADRFPEGAVGRFPEGKSDSPSPNRHFIEPKSLVFIQCVGSRDDKTNPYCSRVCCMYTAKQAHLARDKIPGAEITVFYMDIRAFGKGFEEFHDRVREEDIIYRRGNVGDIFRKDGQLIVRAEDTSLGEIVEIPTDLVVLAVGMVPKSDTKEIARLLRISRSADGFFLEAHPKLRPVDTATDGIFVAGCCQGPKDIPDTVAQASAVAAKAILVLLQDKIKAEGTVVFVNDEICSACRTCEKVCVYGALSLDEEKEVMLSNDALCKGCGACVSTCPSGAIEQKGFKNDQFFAIVDATLSG